MLRCRVVHRSTNRFFAHAIERGSWLVPITMSGSLDKRLRDLTSVLLSSRCNATQDQPAMARLLFAREIHATATDRQHSKQREPDEDGGVV